ncbi:MAG TPA: hypothetical protein VJ436_01485 [Anaerolineales bacterium]|nr:hypothetical protein [Anaerolineales bacterium]
MTFRLERDGTGTRLIDHWRLDTGRPARLEKLAGGKVQSAVAENLGKLKTLLEEGEVVLQGGKLAMI